VLGAQEIKKLKEQSGFYSIYLLDTKPGHWQEIMLGDDFTGLSIEVADSCTFAGMQVAFGNDTLQVPAAHAHGAEQKSELLLPPGPARAFSLYLPPNCGTLRLHVINAGEQGHKKKPLASKQSTACDKPASVDQDEWRNGLAETAQNPVETEVRHIILHHSAGSNTNSNYTEVVRNIYVYHREVLGWDDIGYNFLIARDGTVFDGRDGMGRAADDNVKGAHYCGKNSNTMGICLLGHYSETSPTEEAVSSLIALASWKLQKENLTISDSAIHPSYGNDGRYLAAFAGHREGCATECPGQVLYGQIPEIRTRIGLNMAQNCQYLGHTGHLHPGMAIAPNPCKGGQLTIETGSMQSGTIEVRGLDGRLYHQSTIEGRQAVQIPVGKLGAGCYIIVIQGGQRQRVQKILKL
jgi:hypothetical protein